MPTKIFSQLTNNELKKSELVILKIVQKESFVNKHDERLKCLCTFIDLENIIRIKTKIFQREDDFNIRLSILLLSNHHAIQQLTFSKYLEFGHCGAPFLITVLTENYWVLKSQKLLIMW